ncbi:hypothetical protein ACYZTX_28915 [Pseudomonas sp. MDT1-17]
MKKKIDSVLNLYALLVMVSENSEKFRENAIRPFLKNQTTLCRYTSPERDIYPCSLNTLKTRANTYLNGGFEALDQARSAALKAVASLAITDTKTIKKPQTKDQLATLKREIQLLNEEILYYTVALQSSMEQSRSFANKTNDLVNIRLCEKQHAEIYAFLKHPRSAGDA